MSNIRDDALETIYELPDAILQAAHQFHVPITENTGTQAQREPSQERDVAEQVAYIGPSQPRGPALVNELIGQMSPEERHATLIALWRETNVAKRKLSTIQQVSANTDGSGNLDLLIFQVPMGYELTVTRVNLEAINGSTGASFTPAAPFSAATAWLALYRGERFQFGSVLDFGPPSAGGTIFPSVFTDSDTQAIRLRGGEFLSLHVVGSGTLANAPVAARMQGLLQEL